MDYIIAKKINSKWYGVAGINLGNNSCLAGADHIFYKRLGINTWTPGHKTSWGNVFEKQKNYAGRLENFIILEQ